MQILFFEKHNIIATDVLKSHLLFHYLNIDITLSNFDNLKDFKLKTN